MTKRYSFEFTIALIYFYPNKLRSMLYPLIYLTYPSNPAYLNTLTIV